MIIGSRPLMIAAVASITSVVGPGTYTPLVPMAGEKEIPVAAFRLDRRPVTNGEFLTFVMAHPKWRRDRVARIAADRGYLGHWAAPDALGKNVDPAQPVTRVSWFAAKAYCKARGARLPSEAEWELAASASDGDPAVYDWYVAPAPATLPRVGATPPNAWGIEDLYGVVFEWVYDFNATPADDRACGGGASEATDPTAYPRFMRTALRSSLEGAYTTATLGFRCAEDL
jgi:formylglycine-generating enzyme required for sulfatase activity